MSRHSAVFGGTKARTQEGTDSGKAVSLKTDTALGQCLHSLQPQVWKRLASGWDEASPRSPTKRGEQHDAATPSAQLSPDASEAEAKLRRVFFTMRLPKALAPPEKPHLW